ncbi:MAG: helix-turn-helix transcriptional regulator [Myxococcales bacterium]|nr:helix-turn-helix transcriptional regulator [Myxococcales bacterium]
MPVTPEEVRARIGARIREHAKRRGLSVTELARNAGVSRAHLYGILDGRTAPTSDTLTKLANALGTDPGVLVRPYRGKPPAD